MGWKNIKEHYRIKHIVLVSDGMIFIGSPYVHDLIRVSTLGEVMWGSLGRCSGELARYHAEMTADRAKLRELFHQPDTFAASLPVFTYADSEIIEKQCEAFGWPNTTHDGALMYENTFFRTREEAVKAAKENAVAGISYYQRIVEERAEQLEKGRKDLRRIEAQLAKLEADYPENA